MKLHEFQAKEILKKYGIRTPESMVITDPSEIDNMTMEGDWVIKSQVLVGGRYKAGGIKFAKTHEELKQYAKELFKLKIKGLPNKYLLIEKKLKIEKELYLSIMLDRDSRAPLIIASERGGVDIEDVDPKYIFKKVIDPLIGFSPFIVRHFSRHIGVNLNSTLKQLYKIFHDYDAQLIEINPLVITKYGNVFAVDAKMIIDSSSLYRHKDLPRNVNEESSELEREAYEKGYSFVELDGEVGVMANGAGLNMATLDALASYGTGPRNFLDLSGANDPEIVKNAFPFVLKANPKAILINIFGGITRCDTVAEGIIKAKKELKIDIPIVVRLKGINEDIARELLEKENVTILSEMMLAIKKVSELVKGDKQ
jgi:succinyl-CoA synthetase beta subunit